MAGPLLQKLISFVDLWDRDQLQLDQPGQNNRFLKAGQDLIRRATGPRGIPSAGRLGMPLQSHA